MKEKLVFDWRIREAARADVNDTIEHTFDEGLPDAYDAALLKDKARRTFQFVFEHYPAASAAPL